MITRRGKLGFLERTIAIVATLAVMGFVLSLFLPGVGSREAGPRTQCLNHMHNIALALHNYHAAYGTFPPAYIADDAGRPIHSWRALLLPYLDRRDLYAIYRWDEPWDGPNNSKLHDTVLDVLCCPEDPEYRKSVHTNYVAVIGSETAGPEAAVSR